MKDMAQSATVAVIDVGSNSIKLLIAGAGSGGNRVETVYSETQETRISEGISRDSPELSQEAMQAAIKTIRELLKSAKRHQPLMIRIVATSAVRDALNGQAFAETVGKETGHALEILSGTEEAVLIGRGLACDPDLQKYSRFLQMDIGGGSVEFIRFERHQIKQAYSLQLGAVRLSEQFLPDRAAPVDPSITDAIRRHVYEAVKTCGLLLDPEAGPLIATGGAIVVVRAVLAARDGVNCTSRAPQISLEEISQLSRELCACPLDQRLSIPHLPAARADILPTALITIETVLQLAQRNSLTHSFYNLRYGIASELLQSIR